MSYNMLEGGVHGSVLGLSKTYRTKNRHEGIVDEITLDLIRSKQHIRSYPMILLFLYLLRLSSKPPL